MKTFFSTARHALVLSVSFLYCFIATLLLLPAAADAQLSIGSTVQPADASSQLDVFSSSKGALLPRMTTANRTGISPAADGLIVYDTDLNGYYYYDNGSWHEYGPFKVSAGVLQPKNSTIPFATGGPVTHTLGSNDRFSINFDATNPDEVRFHLGDSLHGSGLHGYDLWMKPSGATGFEGYHVLSNPGPSQLILGRLNSAGTSLLSGIRVSDGTTIIQNTNGTVTGYVNVFNNQVHLLADSSGGNYSHLWVSPRRFYTIKSYTGTQYTTNYPDTAGLVGQVMYVKEKIGNTKTLGFKTGSLMEHVSVSLDSAEIVNLDSIPQVLVPAPDAGEAIVPIKVIFKYTAGSNDYTGGDYEIRMDSGPDGVLSWYRKSLNAWNMTTNSSYELVPQDFGTTSLNNELYVENDALVISADTAPTGGNGTAEIEVLYMIIPY